MVVGDSSFVDSCGFHLGVIRGRFRGNLDNKQILTKIEEVTKL